MFLFLAMLQFMFRVAFAMVAGIIIVSLLWFTGAIGAALAALGAIA